VVLAPQRRSVVWVEAEVTNNDGGDGKPGPKPDTATAEPPTNQ
jgi:hypothetical protein